MSRDNYNRVGHVGGNRGGGIDDDDAASTTSLTYEQMMASTRESNLPDKVAWNSSTSYRNNPYRQLHHQRGIIGYVHVRLVEGRDLSNTSNPNNRRKQELLNPFAVLRLASAERTSSFESLNHDELSNIQFLSRHESSIDKDMHAPDDSHHHHHHEVQPNPNSNNEDVVRSSSVIRSNNPSWSSSMTSSFRIPLRKGSLHPEGSPVLLYAHVRHDPNADPHGGGGGGIGLPLPFFGMGGDQEDKRHVGYALVDVTSLLFGKDNILDVWAPLSRDFPTSAADVTYHNQVPEPIPASKKTGNLKDGGSGVNSTSATRGSIRMLLSYSPNGMRPQPNDWVTFESFARSSTNLLFCHGAASSHGTMTQPMKVLSIRGDFMMIQYNMLQEKKKAALRTNTTSQQQQQRERQRQQQLLSAHYAGDRKMSSSVHGSITSQSSHGSSSPNEDLNCSNIKSSPMRQQQQPQRKQQQQVVKYGKLRVHRNTVFVIERISFMDSTVNTVLTPVDIVSKLPLTQDVGRAVGPYVGAVGDLVMPAILSSKLVWAAARTTASAGITGVATAGKVLVLAAAAGKRNHEDPSNHR